MRKKPNTPLLLTLILLTGASLRTSARADSLAGSLAAVEVGNAAVRTVKPAWNTAKAVAEVPAVAAEVVYLPMGLLEIALCPLPGPSLGGGLRNTGRGLIAPFKLAVTILRLPTRLINGIAVVD